jgi:hypothetical protein
MDAAIFGELSGGAGLIGELGGTAIYNRIAPPEAGLPYVIFQWQGGGDENLTPSRMRNVVYVVKGVAGELSKAEAIDAECDALLHGQALSVAGWSNFWLARESDVAYVEVDESGRPVYHSGGLYRIRIGK